MFGHFCGGSRFVFSRQLSQDRKKCCSFTGFFRNLHRERTSWYWYRAKAKHLHQPQPLMLWGGTVAFLWDRERISNEEVMNGVKDYLERVSSDLHVSTSNMTGGSEPLTSSSSSSSSPSSSSPASSLAHAASWSMLDWFSRSSSKNTLTSSCDSQASVSDEYTLSSYTGWARTWFSWSKPTVPVSTTEDQIVSELETEEIDMCEESIEDKMKKKLYDAEWKRKEEFCEALRHHLKTHSEQRMASVPLVGMIPRERWRDMNVGPRLLEHVFITTKTKVVRFLDKNLTTILSQLSDDHSLASLDDSCSTSESSESDLACIEGAFSFYHQKSSQSEDLYKLYMLVDWDASPVDVSRPHHNLTVERLDTERSIISRLRKIRSRVNSMKEVFCLNLEYFREDLLIETCCVAIDPTMDAVFQNTMRNFLVASKELCSRFIEQFPSKYGRTSNIHDHRPCKKSLTFKLELDSTSVPRYINTGTICNTGLDERSAKLSVVTGELDKIVSTSSCVLYDDSASRKRPSEHLLGWECINQDYNYVAYRKLYKDTGLFQYKVIGQYDDITARDFFDVQVNHALRKDWDVYAGDLVVMDSDQQSNCKLIHWIMKYPFPMSNREYLFVQRSWTSDNNDVMVVMNRAASHPAVEDTGRHVRVSDYFSQMIIKARSSINEPGMHFELTYFDNPRTNLPSSCVNWVTFSALPDFMSKIHAAAYSKLKQNPN